MSYYTVLISSRFLSSILIADGDLWKAELVNVQHLDICGRWILRIVRDAVLYLIESQTDATQHKYQPDQSTDDVSVVVHHVPAWCKK